MDSRLCRSPLRGASELASYPDAARRSSRTIVLISRVRIRLHQILQRGREGPFVVSGGAVPPTPQTRFSPFEIRLCSPEGFRTFATERSSGPGPQVRHRPKPAGCARLTNDLLPTICGRPRTDRRVSERTLGTRPGKAAYWRKYIRSTDRRAASPVLHGRERAVGREEPRAGPRQDSTRCETSQSDPGTTGGHDIENQNVLRIPVCL